MVDLDLRSRIEKKASVKPLLNHYVIACWRGRSEVDVVSRIQAQTNQGAIHLAEKEYRESNNLQVWVKVETKILFFSEDENEAINFLNDLYSEMEKNAAGQSSR